MCLGDAALLDAAKKGNLGRVMRLVTADNINCRDAQGRNSTPLHLAGEFFLVWGQCARHKQPSLEPPKRCGGGSGAAQN